MGLEQWLGQMVQVLKGNGIWVMRTAKVILLIRLVINTQDILRIVWHMVMEFIQILLEQYMKDNGSKICNMATELKNGWFLIIVHFLVCLNSVLEMDKVFGSQNQKSMKETGLIIWWRVKVQWNTSKLSKKQLTQTKINQTRHHIHIGNRINQNYLA